MYVERRPGVVGQSLGAPAGCLIPFTRWTPAGDREVSPPGMPLHGYVNPSHGTLHASGEAIEANFGRNVPPSGRFRPKFSGRMSHPEPDHPAEGPGTLQPQPREGRMLGRHRVELSAQSGDSVRIDLSQECQGHVPALWRYPTQVRGGGGDPVHRPGGVGERLGCGSDPDEEAHRPRLGGATSGDRARFSQPIPRGASEGVPRGGVRWQDN
ncbi:MAG: hypothetical protein RL134_1108 [Actinomycetota bacterium]